MTDDDLKRLFDSMRQENAAAHSETRRHFEVLSEGARKDIQLVAESVLHLNEKFARTDEKIERTAAETQAMIKFSHVEIDRRMRSLEDAVADLQSRVERLEGSTH
jgi:threonine aldolase